VEKFALSSGVSLMKAPILMASAMKNAVIAGRMPKKRYADLSSPLAGLI